MTLLRLPVVACCFLLSSQEVVSAIKRMGVKLGVSFFGVIVDNLPRALPADDDQWVFIHGSNRDHDFSAYSEGLCKFLEKEKSDVILFFNDTLFTLRGAYANLREIVPYVTLINQLKVPSICGRVDRYDILCHSNIWSNLQIYVSSYCFLLNQKAFFTLLSLSDYAHADGVTSDIPVDDVSWGGGLPGNFREFIRAFVQYGHHKFMWPGRKRYLLDVHTLSIKARCIYFEHRLSGEISRDGCLIGTNLRTLPRWRIFWSEKLITLWINVKSIRLCCPRS